jgi:hypothetical protein
VEVYDDAIIRAHLRSGLEKRLPEDALIIDELGIHGGHVRADLTVLTRDKIVGYEIKSDKDSLARLPNQVKYYSKLYDQCYLVCGEKYVRKVTPILRHWWGVYSIKPDWITPSLPQFEVYRKPGINPSPQNWALVRLLWRDEVIALLQQQGLLGKSPRGSKYSFYQILLAHNNRETLLAKVHLALSSRSGWR